MSPGGRAEHVTSLRATIARIEGEAERHRMAHDTRPGDQRPDSQWPDNGRPDTRQTGVRLGPDGFWLDRVLGGGLRQGALHEVVPGGARDQAAASGFVLGVAARCLLTAGRSPTLVWIVEDNAARESGLPYRPGLRAHGLDPDRLILVRTRDAQSTLWTTEEVLRLPGMVVVTELWGGRDYGLAPSRRLVLAAGQSGGTALLLHAGLPGTAHLSSGCDTRLTVTACGSLHHPILDTRLPVPGPAAFWLRIDKLRGASARFDPSVSTPLVWDAEQRCFHDHEPPVAMAALPSDRPAEARGWFR